MIVHMIVPLELYTHDCTHGTVHMGPDMWDDCIHRTVHMQLYT